MTDITLDSVRKTFDGVTAVDGIDLEVNDGELLVLVGPSGCGKSTTLRLIAGLETPTTGDVSFGDEVVTESEPKDRNVAMVFQNYALYPHMTAERNMSFGAGSATSFTGAEIDQRVEEAAEILDIDDLLERKPAALSGGEKQRVAIGRALVRDPDVFLLDEPLSNLDAKLRIQMRGELTSLHREIGTTMVYVTHDQTEAMTLGDRVAVLNDGRLQQIDTPQSLYDFPANRFVAEFIGSPAMNTLPVDVVERDDRIHGEAPGVSITFPGDSSLTSHVGERAILGVRPEDLRPSETAENPDFTPEILSVEPLGDIELVRCMVGDEELIVQTDPHSGLDHADELPLACDTERIHLFDDETGRAVYHSDPAHHADAQSPPAGEPLDRVQADT